MSITKFLLSLSLLTLLPSTGPKWEESAALSHEITYEEGSCRLRVEKPPRSDRWYLLEAGCDFLKLPANEYDRLAGFVEYFSWIEEISIYSNGFSNGKSATRNTITIAIMGRPREDKPLCDCLAVGQQIILDYGYAAKGANLDKDLTFAHWYKDSLNPVFIKEE